MKGGYDAAKKNFSNYDKIIIYFMTDGSSSYPTNAVKMFNEDKELMSKLEFHCVGFGDGDFSVLKDIVSAISVAKMTNAISVVELKTSF